MNNQRLVIIESPYAGDVETNTRYARAALTDSLRRGEAPIASHLLYTQVLDDLDPRQRDAGILAGLAWGAHADATIVYTDLGTSSGMLLGIDRATAEGRTVEYRTIPGWAAGPPGRRSRTVYRKHDGSTFKVLETIDER
jgi:hypothetical protein